MTTAPTPAPSTAAPAIAPRRPRAIRPLHVALLVPSALLVALVALYPLIYAALQSVRDGSLIDAGSFAGLANYQSVLTSSGFWRAALFTLVFTVVGVFGSWLIGLGLALLLQKATPGRTVFKVLLMLPWVVPVVVSSTAWNWLVATPQSPVPRLLGAIGLDAPAFLADPVLAGITVCVFKVWISFPFMMLMASAALASVDHSVYEAAGMDGANRWQQLTGITLPIIARPTYVSWILMTIFCVNDFPTIYLLTGGGPIDATTSLVVLAYRAVFQDFQVGQGVAIAFMGTLAMVLVSLVLFRQIRKAEIE
jgi:multiple sugar transport system permease protein